jgi:hypothetical protein
VLACSCLPAFRTHSRIGARAPATLLLTLSPGRHDRYFDELAEILAADGPPNSDAIAALRKR